MRGRVGVAMSHPPAPVPASAQPCVCGHDYQPWHAPGMEGGDACGFPGCPCRMFLAPSALPASADVEAIIRHVSAAMAHRFSNCDAEANDYAPYLREVVARLKGGVE